MLGLFWNLFERIQTDVNFKLNIPKYTDEFHNIGPLMQMTLGVV